MFFLVSLFMHSIMIFNRNNTSDCYNYISNVKHFDLFTVSKLIKYPGPYGLLGKGILKGGSCRGSSRASLGPTLK